MVVKKKKNINMRNYIFFNKKKLEYFIYLTFIFIILNMLAYTIFIIPFYKYICSISDLEQNVNSIIIKKKNLIYNTLEKNNYNTIHNNNNEFIIIENKTSILNINMEIYLIKYDFLKVKEVVFNFRFINFIFYIEDINKSINLLFDYKINDIINNNKWICLTFLAKVSNLGFLEFKTLQDNIIVMHGETTLCFFRLYNPTNYNLTCISYYLIFPNNYSIYITKLQCFCFDTILINKFETLELPVLFFISNGIYEEIKTITRFYLYYLILLKN